MDDIDKTLSDLTSQIGQFDTSSSSSLSSSSVMKNNIYKYSKKYLFYWPFRKIQISKYRPMHRRSI